mmetsp:Transcript_48679/g.103873  ORF Transcript_48679/g.103873 Transcript_48679/m.103873 type:complete len:149 (-) Transcript_48679:266-712(-)
MSARLRQPLITTAAGIGALGVTYLIARRGGSPQLIRAKSRATCNSDRSRLTRRPSWEAKFSGPDHMLSNEDGESSVPARPAALEPTKPMFVMVDGKGLLVQAKIMPEFADEEFDHLFHKDINEGECDGEDLLDPTKYRQRINSICAGA